MPGQRRKKARKLGESGVDLMMRMSQEHEDVLQNIEFALVSTWRSRQDVDDRACYAAIESVLLGMLPGDDAVLAIVAQLKMPRALRTDVAEALWNDGLRVVAESIANHSDRRPGELEYLNFVGAYIA